MNLNQLVADVAENLASGCGMIFVGAGISAGSHLPTWFDLLKPFAAKIGLEIDMSDNLPQIAQFIVNEMGNSGPLFQSLKKRIGKRAPNSYHESLKRTNLRTIWTTNYDTLLEDSFAGFVDVKTHDDTIGRAVSDQQIEIIKIHGCINDVREIVLTQENYEDFFVNHPAMSERLKIDLLNNSFLFIGYRFGDPDITNILIEARRLAHKNTRQQHYMIQKEESDPRRLRIQRLWVEDLKRIGISCVLIDDYKHLDNALCSIMLRSRGRTVFVTGGHKEDLREANEYGKIFADIDNLKILDGQSEGISRKIISAFTEVCIQKKQDIRGRLQIFPNPYRANVKFANDTSLLPELKKWRVPLLRMAHIAVIFPGRIGTKAEVEVAREMGCFILPVPQKKGDFPSELLKDAAIRKRLASILPEYTKRAQSWSITPALVKESVEKLLQV